MAQGRPLSRQGRYEPFGGMQMGEPDNDDLYNHPKYTAASYTSPRPKSGYRRRRSPTAEYDQYARVTYPATESRREPPPARPESRRGMDGFGGGSLRQGSSDDDSDDDLPSPPSHPFGSPESPPSLPAKTYQARPPSASSRPPTSGRMSSARIRSARQQYGSGTPLSDVGNDLSDMRPPSSFTKYRLLPAIGTPTPPDPGPDELDMHTPRAPPTPSALTPSHQQISPPPQHNSRQSSQHASRVSSAVSDISVISTKASCRSRMSYNERPVSEMVERLDLSVLNKSDSSRRKKTSVHSSPAHKAKSSAARQDADPGEIYDGDDDDSDTSVLASGQKDLATATPPNEEPPKPSSALKKPVIIPSPDSPPEAEILLAVKLPQDGTRHQRYFGCQEKLQAIVDFAEEVGGEDMGGYILVACAPKQVYSDLEMSIDMAGLEDKTVLHLEEGD